MYILSCAPEDSSIQEIACCNCGKIMRVSDTVSYIVTKSNLISCQDCVDELVSNNILKNWRPRNDSHN